MTFIIERARACGIKWVGLSMKRSIKPIGFDNCNSGRSGHIISTFKNISSAVVLENRNLSAKFITEIPC